MNKCYVKDCIEIYYGRGLCYNHWKVLPDVIQKLRENRRRYKKLHPEKDKNYYEKIKNTPEFKKRRGEIHQRFKQRNPDYYKIWAKNNPEKKLSYDIKALSQLLPFYPNLKDSWDMAYALSHWADLVKKRDDYTCLNCGNTKKLHAHHILYPKIQFPLFILDVYNGVTFCGDCHDIYHQLFG